MKITKRQLRRVIREEKRKLQEMDVASDAQLAKKAEALGAYLGGFPNLALDLYAVLEKHGRTESADALKKAYEMAQSELDMIYSVMD